ncbi:WXG100 family type VII secretion target [Sphaerisporangium perillae]|uniref:WXG100 family type VII secretion target n=1 Tax=Sphaerisporangium perillae TaxID=2935860 RepID=UPI00200C38FC|nr:WXG100 family type VII secretion target [Sphaerisporangium perillae]
MSDIDAVAALPGGGALAALARKVEGDPQAIRDIAKRWRTAGAGIAERVDALDVSLSRVDAAWKGDSADAFVAYMGRYGGASDALHTALTNCADCLDNAADAVETAKNNVKNECAGLLEWARELRRINPDATEEELDEAITTEAGTRAGLAQRYVDTAEGILSTAKSDIVKHLGEATPEFADIPPAGENSAFVEKSTDGKEWVPTSKSEYDAYFNRGTYSDAAQASSGGQGWFGGYGPSGAPPPGGGPAPKGQVAGWIQQAIEILKAQGYPVEKMNVNDIWMIIQHESGGNPQAINTWDSNAAAGHPSKGLMQTIDPTFDRWSLPGHRNIYDPVDNIIAGVRYAIERYGSVSNVPGVIGTKDGTGYRGY